MALPAILSLGIGVLIGLLGGGGSILTVPMLVYLVGMEEKESIASSLFLVGITSVIGVIAHARHGHVRWRTGFLFGSVGMGGAFVGGMVARWLPGHLLLLFFGMIMLATSVAMMGERRAGPPLEGSTPWLKLGFLASLVGMVSGLLGAGGGFLVVPTLILLGGLAVSEAIGTSLLIMSMQALAGFSGHAPNVELDWKILGIITGLAGLGTIAGSHWGQSFSQHALRRAFAFLVLFMSILVIGKQVPGEFLANPLARIGGAIGGIATIGLVLRHSGRSKKV